VYSQNAGESAQVGYTSRPSPAVRSADHVTPGRSLSPSTTICVTSVATVSATRAASANSVETHRILARESTSTLASSVPVTMVDTGTGTAPMCMAPRIAVSSSTPSAMHSMTRSSGRVPRARNPAATRLVSSASSA
jgi:hypothetical protein